MNIYVQIFLLLFIFFTFPLTAQISSNNSHYLLASSNTPTKFISAVDFEAWLKTKFQLSEKISLKPLQKETDHLGFTHQRHQILQSGIPIEGAIFISHSDEKDNLISSNGSLFDFPNITLQASITPEEALQKAMEHVNAETYRWEIEAENQHRNRLTKGKKSSYLPIPELIIAPKNLDYQIQDFRLSYKIDIYALQPFQRLWVYVDAQTAEIIATQNQICEHYSSKDFCASEPSCSHLPKDFCASLSPCSPSPSKSSPLASDTPATAITKYSGTQTITTFQEDNTYLLQEEQRNIYTYNIHQSNLFSQATVFEDADNHWDNFNEQQDEIATDVHWGTEQTYDYFLERHGRKSFDGKGIAIRSYVHFIKPLLGSTFNNAFWDGEHLVYGDGDGIQRSASTALDICAHEFTHAITDYTANLINWKESGALNESFSDIFAIAIEHHVKGEVANFLFGEEVVLDGRIALRSAANPKKQETPDTYEGEYWNFDQTHHRSNVQTHWFYLLVNGGTGINDLGNSYDIEGIGLGKATDIAYRNLTVYLTPPSGYADARFFSIRAAMDLFGDCSFEVEQVAKAWQAVGVGKETLEVVAAFEADETEFCSQTATVQFTNHSLWADSFTWNFGDGNTSQEAHPTHTYQGFGEYTIELTARSCQGETTTLSQEKWVHLGENVASCNEAIVDIAEQQIFSDCQGILYDDGGGEEDYSRIKKSQARIEVPDADYLTLDFFQFDTGNNHELHLYDGKDDKAPEIGAYWGSRLPNDGETIVTRGNTLHLQFDPLGGENRSFPGFAMEWQCHSNARKPLAEFTSNEAFICQGQVSFIEKSYYKATEWHWDFGDGNQSEAQNPIHIYRKKGNYDVQLVACNAFGCDTSKQVAFVKIKEDSKCFEVRIPSSGKTTVNHCSGKILDNGGELGFYGNNVSGRVVVEPPNAERIGFAIQAFATEAKDDLLLVYDGNSLDAPLLLSQSGFEFPKDTIWAESGAVTFYFRSDEAVFNPGFEIVYFSESEATVPQAAFSWNLPDVPIAVPLSFQNQSQKANQWLWDFGDGNVSKLKNPTHVYAVGGTYTVTLIVENCYASDTLQKTIQVQSTPILELDKQELTLALPAGESGSQVLELSNIGTGNLYFGIENKAFESDTTVEKYYTNLATDTYFFDNLRPFSELRLELIINGDFDDDLEYLQLWIEDDYILQVGINNQSAANGTDIEASFSFKASNNEVIQWLDDGQLKIAVGRSNQVALNQGGKDYYRLRVVTDHRDWLQIGSKNGIIGGGTEQELLVTFNAQNLWAGTYTNELHIFSNDTPNSPKMIPCTLEVIARPIAQFKHQTASICTGSVNFWEESINEADSWTWDFGDGTTSNEQHPTHKYAESGNFEVTLEVCKSGFCDVITEMVTVAPIAKFVFSPNDVPQQTEIRFSNQSVGFNSYEWDFGDGQIATDRNPKHRFEVAGNYVVTLIAKNCFGADTLQKEVRIQGLPQAVVPLERVEVTLEAGQQAVENVAIQNVGLGDLSYQAAIKREYGKSTAVFEGEGATTVHIFEGVVAEDFLQLKVTLNGDFDEADERVWIRLEGEGVAYVLDNNTETTEDEIHYVTLAPELYRHLLVDGVLEIELENSQKVEARTDRANKHSVELIAFGVPWVETTTSNQTVSIGGERNLLLTFDARELNAGIYEIPITITSNELPTAEYVIPTRLEVLGEAELELGAVAVDFGEVRIQEESKISFHVFNSGTDTLFVSELFIDSDVFEVAVNSLILPPKEMYEGILTFQPTEIIDYAANLEIQSNVGTQMLELKGEGIGAPQIVVVPDSLWVVVEAGKQASRVLTISNVGTAEMVASGEPATFIRFDSLSTQGFTQVGDTTWHIFKGLEVTDSVQLDFVLEGDFNETWEFVEVFVNGIWQAQVGIESVDSAFVVEGSLQFAWEDLMVGDLEEGRLELMLVNSEEVNTGLTAVQNHEVRLQTFDSPWLEGRLEESVVEVGESREWGVFFDASDLPIGIYQQDIHLFSDDVEQGLVLVPTTLEVVKILEAEEVDFVAGHGVWVYPNPTAGKVILVYDLPAQGVFQLFDLQGRELKNEALPKGQSEWILEVEDLMSGVYLYHLSLEGKMIEKGKLLLMR